jgi:hypothetical protein
VEHDGRTERGNGDEIPLGEDELMAKMEVLMAPGTQRSNLRCDLAEDLFAEIPELAQDLGGHPQRGEDCLAFLKRLQSGPTPEEALSFAAHALQPRHAVWWAHECLVARAELLTPTDREMLTLAARWVATQDEASRNSAMIRALNAERGPGTWVAMGAGSTTPKAMLGRMVATGVLLTLSRIDLDERRRWLAQFAFMAQSLAFGD